jgi:large subunit ribosomal protein L10
LTWHTPHQVTVAETDVNREQKQDLISSLNTLLQDQAFVAVTHYKGLTVKQLEDLRGKAREEGAGFRVTKNRLTRLALAGTKFEGLSDLFTGPTAIAYSSDPVAAAKVCSNFAKDNENLVILGGALDGQVMTIDQVNDLAKLPSLDELRAKIVGMISTPATRIAGVLQAPGGQLARVLNAKAQQGEAA